MGALDKLALYAIFYYLLCFHLLQPNQESCPLQCLTMQVPADLEVGHVPPSPMGTFPGLFLFTSSARMMRPVRQVAPAPDGGPPRLELIGPFEQVSTPERPLLRSPKLLLYCI